MSASRDALRQARRRRLLDDFLVAPLHGAIALAERDHAARTIAENLHLDVPRALDEFSRNRPPPLKFFCASALDAVEGRRQLRRLAHSACRCRRRPPCS